MESNPIARIVEPVVRRLSIVCGYLILCLAILVFAEIISRKIFVVSLYGVDDFGGYVLAATAVFGATYCLITRAHSRVDLFFTRFPQWIQGLCNTAAMLAFALVAAWAAWRGSVVLGESVEFQSRGNTLPTPLWIPQAIWFAGLCLLALVAALCAAHALWLCFAGSPKLNVWYGPPDQAREVEEQTTHLLGIEAQEADNG